MTGYILLSQGAARPGLVYGPHYGFSPWMKSPEPRPRQRVQAWTPTAVSLASGMPGRVFVASGTTWVDVASHGDAEPQWISLGGSPTPPSHADPRLSNRIER